MQRLVSDRSHLFQAKSSTSDTSEGISTEVRSGTITPAAAAESGAAAATCGRRVMLLVLVGLNKETEGCNAFRDLFVRLLLMTGAANRAR